MPEPENTGMPKLEMGILLLCDTWKSLNDGIPGVNRSLALELTRFKGIKIYTTIFEDESTLTSNDIEEIRNNGVQVISPPPQDEESKGIYMKLRDEGKTIYDKVNEEPLSVFPNLQKEVGNVTHIVGHSPITAAAAIKLKETTYPRAKLILFNHIIPQDLTWLEHQLPFAIPTDTELVEMAEKADVVFSVTNKCHWYYTAKFKNRANKKIDHRVFYPQCSEKIFSITRDSVPSERPEILVLTDTLDTEDWLGIDIANCAVHKIKAMSNQPIPVLKIGGIPSDKVDSVREKLSDSNHSNESVVFSDYSNIDNLYRDLDQCAVCLVPSRAEPFGTIGLLALSSGIPTLLPKDSNLASLIGGLTSEPEYFQVRVTPDVSAYRQDASLWRDKILDMLRDPETAHARANQLKIALRRDEFTKESHDHFISYILGGISLLHKARMIKVTAADEDMELPLQRNFNCVLFSIMKQCWRLKHHPLTKERDLFQIIPGQELPISTLVEKVTEKIEERDRRIVGANEETGAFIVYCPTPDALTDLWAMCDVINKRLVETLQLNDPFSSPLLTRFGLISADVVTEMSGPELLTYKAQIMKNLIVEKERNDEEMNEEEMNEEDMNEEEINQEEKIKEDANQEEIPNECNKGDN